MCLSVPADPCPAAGATHRLVPRAPLLLHEPTFRHTSSVESRARSRLFPTTLHGSGPVQQTDLCPRRGKQNYTWPIWRARGAHEPYRHGRSLFFLSTAFLHCEKSVPPYGTSLPAAAHSTSPRTAYLTRSVCLQSFRRVVVVASSMCPVVLRKFPWLMMLLTPTEPC